MDSIKEFGLFGNPLSHSFSESFFNEKFHAEHIPATYSNFELEDIGELMELIAEHPQLHGFNVTIPYKEQIIPYLTDISPEAEAIGAVNVVKIVSPGTKDFRLIGYNTDYLAFKKTVEELLGDIKRNALILGTGGASKAIEFALKELDFTTKKVSRTPSKKQLSYDALDKTINDYFLIVNTTPLGTYPKTTECPAIPYDILSNNHLCYDLVYNPGLTEFMKKCAEKGAAVKNGYQMLILQAQLSWDIWSR